MRALITNLNMEQDGLHKRSGAIVAYAQYMIGNSISELFGGQDSDDASTLHRMAVRSFVHGVLWTLVHTDRRDRRATDENYPQPTGTCSLDRKWLKDDTVVYIG